MTLYKYAIDVKLKDIIPWDRVVAFSQEQYEGKDFVVVSMEAEWTEFGKFTTTYIGKSSEDRMKELQARIDELSEELELLKRWAPWDRPAEEM